MEYFFACSSPATNPKLLRKALELRVNVMRVCAFADVLINCDRNGAKYHLK